MTNICYYICSYVILSLNKFLFLCYSVYKTKFCSYVILSINNTLFLCYSVFKTKFCSYVILSLNNSYSVYKKADNMASRRWYSV